MDKFMQAYLLKRYKDCLKKLNEKKSIEEIYRFTLIPFSGQILKISKLELQIEKRNENETMRANRDKGTNQISLTN